MIRPSTQGRFPSARSAPFVLADLFAQMAVEGVTIYREWKTVGDSRTRAQAYYDLKKRLNLTYGGLVIKPTRGPDGLYAYQREMADLIKNMKGPIILGWDFGE